LRKWDLIIPKTNTTFMAIGIKRMDDRRVRWIIDVARRLSFTSDSLITVGVIGQAGSSLLLVIENIG
jgi:hypothetical protein